MSDSSSWYLVKKIDPSVDSSFLNLDASLAPGIRRQNVAVNNF